MFNRLTFFIGFMFTNLFISLLFLIQRINSDMPLGEAWSKFGIAMLMALAIAGFISLIIPS